MMTLKFDDLVEGGQESEYTDKFRDRFGRWIRFAINNVQNATKNVEQMSFVELQEDDNHFRVSRVTKIDDMNFASCAFFHAFEEIVVSASASNDHFEPGEIEIEIRYIEDEDFESGEECLIEFIVTRPGKWGKYVYQLWDMCDCKHLANNDGGAI